MSRFTDVTSHYRELKIGLIGDFCLDRYFEIDPRMDELSIETGLPVHRVIRTRCQAGGAGTVLNNLIALGVQCYPIGVCGEDGEGWELQRAIRKTGANMEGWQQNTTVRTFTYNKPLVMHPDRPPEELNRIDIKNRTDTPETVRQQILSHFQKIAPTLHFCILMEQVDTPNKGVFSPDLVAKIAQTCAQNDLPCIADSRLGLDNFPAPIILKMNRHELNLLQAEQNLPLEKQMLTLATKRQQTIFVTMAENGICVATPGQEFYQIPAVLLPGDIDVVGAGDSVTANLAAALASGATLPEAMQLAMAAGAIIVHKLGTTGTASVPELATIIQQQSSKLWK